MKKKIAVILLAALQMFLLSGCWNYVEIDQQINVSGIALDVGREGKRLHLSAEIITVGKGEHSQFESHVMEAEGNTVFEAIRELMNQSSKKLYFGHCKLLVIGEDLARAGIRELLDLPLRNHELRTTMDVIIARGCDGRDILLTKGLTSTIVSYRVSDMLKTCQKTIGCAAMVKDYQIYDALAAEGLAVTIPALELTKIDSEDAALLCGAGVFDGDRLIGWLTARQTALLSLLRGKYNTGLITTESAESPWYSTSFEVYSAGADTKLAAAGGTVRADIRVKLRVNVGETQTRTDYLDPAQTQKAARALEGALDHDLLYVVRLSQQTFRCDILGIGQRLSKTDPALWRSLGPDWKARYPQLGFTVRTEVTIISSGVSNVAEA